MLASAPPPLDLDGIKGASQVQVLHDVAPPTPPDDGSSMYTVNDLILDRVRNIPHEPLVGYPATARGCDDYVYYTATDISRFADGAVSTLVAQGLPLQSPTEVTTDNKVVAILGPSNLDYIVTLLALSRMGYAVLLLSTRLATEAYVSLLDKTGCNDLLTCPSTVHVVAGIRDIKAINHFTIPEKPKYERGPSVPIPPPESSLYASSKIAWIIHSSGSTGLPKPIFQKHSACLSNYASSKAYRAFLTLPLYHNHGLCTFFRAIFKAKPIAIYNANLPLSGQNLLKAMRKVDAESFHGVPYGLKLLAETEGGIAALAKFEQVVFGGSSCPDDLGDKLVKGGVKLVSHYGATEMGQLMTSYRPPSDTAWNYVRPLPSVAPYLHMEPQGDGSFECVILDGLPTKVTSNCDNPPNSFHTSDTFLPHPSIPNAWKYLGRIDDRVTLVNGEKVLPVPIEHRVRQSEYVREALVFGLGRALPGMLIVPSEHCEGRSKKEILEAVWPDIEMANRKAEAFSQISKELVVILDGDVNYPATDKGTMIRAASYRKFADIIQTAYDIFEGGEEDNNSEKLRLGIDELKIFLTKLFNEEVGTKDIGEDDDFFDAGVDSLQALKARAFIKRQLDLGGAELGQNVVFEYQNINRLATHIHGLRTGQHSGDDDELQAMADLIEKYSHFEKHAPSNDEVVLLTGTTGSLGAYILSQLMQLDNIKKIYCLVRASSSDIALDRVLSTLALKELPIGNVGKIVALPGNLSEPKLGLSAHVFNEMQSTLTKVIHSAWAVNFNLGVRSFEKQHIGGVHNIINLCLSSRREKPAEFYFCSSISAAAGTPLPAVITEGPIPELSYAQSMGYARSKLVAERIVQAAAEKTGMVAKVLRVGQIVGDTQTGLWNTTEAIPLMIQSAVAMKALPALDETPSWLPVDLVARSILELCSLISTTPNPTPYNQDPTIIYHVQNPSVFHWTTDLLPALRSAGLTFETVPQREWIRRLRSSDPDPQRNPTIKLLDFFAEKYDNDKMGRKGLVFEMEKTRAASVTLRDGFDVIGQGLIRKFVEKWIVQWAKDCSSSSSNTSSSSSSSTSS